MVGRLIRGLTRGLALGFIAGVLVAIVVEVCGRLRGASPAAVRDASAAGVRDGSPDWYRARRLADEAEHYAEHPITLTVPRVDDATE